MRRQSWRRILKTDFSLDTFAPPPFARLKKALLRGFNSPFLCRESAYLGRAPGGVRCGPKYFSLR